MSDPYCFDSRVGPLTSSYGLQPLPNFEPKPKDQAIQWFGIKVSIANTLSVRVELRWLISTRATYQTYHIMEKKKHVTTNINDLGDSLLQGVLEKQVNLTSSLADSLDTLRALRPGRFSR